MSSGRIQDVIDAIADGENVDWTAARRQLGDATSQAKCAQLETVSRIWRVSQEGRSDIPDVAESRWVPLLLALAAVEIAVGLVATLAYRELNLVNALRFLTVLSFAVMGLVLRSNRHNPRARDLGTVFLLRSCSFSRFSYTLAINAWLPAATLATILRTGMAMDAWTPFFVWQFVRRFPETARFTSLDRFAIGMAKVAAVVGTALFATNAWVAWHPDWNAGRAFAIVYEEGPRYAAVIYSLILPALPVILMRSRSAAPDERTRVRLFSLVMVLGLAPQAFEVLLEASFSSYVALIRGSETFRTIVITLVLVPLITVPVATGYMVLVHRMLDARLAIRQGLRYLLARYSLTLLTLVPFGLLALHVYTHRAESVASVLSGVGALLALLVAAGGALLAGRTFLMGAIDRWFDRHRSDRSHVLAEMGEAMRLVRTRSELATGVQRAVGAALNANAVVHFFDPQRRAYVPFGHGGPALPDESALSSVLRRDPSVTVLITDAPRSIARYLPPGDRVWVEAGSVAALAAIRSPGADRPSALIVCGPRRDALEYSTQDEQLLTTMASSAGIALDNLQLKTAAVGDDADEEFGLLCARCYRVDDYSATHRLCACGGELTAAAVPRRINKKFLVEALLGAGGMGVAYLASDLTLRRQVAIKTLPMVSAAAMARLASEAQTMASLSHPNLATILERSAWRGTPIMVCEYLSGGTLQRRLEREGLSVAEARTLGLTLLGALDYMHRHQVLHRDIKPSNIAFTADGVPKLLDFGLAALVEGAHAVPRSSNDSVAPASTLAGTVPYLPPQAFDGARPTPFFDCWALAVVLLEAITGQHPFAEGPDTVANICRGRIRSPRPNRLDSHDPLHAFLREALATPSDPRLGSAQAMREALTSTT